MICCGWSEIQYLIIVENPCLKLNHHNNCINVQHETTIVLMLVYFYDWGFLSQKSSASTRSDFKTLLAAPCVFNVFIYFFFNELYLLIFLCECFPRRFNDSLCRNVLVWEFYISHFYLALL